MIHPVIPPRLCKQKIAYMIFLVHRYSIKSTRHGQCQGISKNITFRKNKPEFSSDSRKPNVWLEHSWKVSTDYVSEIVGFYNFTFIKGCCHEFLSIGSILHEGLLSISRGPPQWRGGRYSLLFTHNRSQSCCAVLHPSLLDRGPAMYSRGLKHNKYKSMTRGPPLPLDGPPRAVSNGA